MKVNMVCVLIRVWTTRKEEIDKFVEFINWQRAFLLTS